MDCSLPGSFIHGILQATILGWVAMPSSSRGSPQARDRTQVSRIAGGFFIRWATRVCIYVYVYIHVIICTGFPNGSAVKNPPARQETRETKFQSLGQEVPLKEEMSTSVFLPGKFHGQKSLVRCSPWWSQRVGHDWACMRAYSYSLRCCLYKWDCALYCVLFWIVLLFI